MYRDEFMREDDGWGMDEQAKKVINIKTKETSIRTKEDWCRQAIKTD
jgi:hypothetical protein